VLSDSFHPRKEKEEEEQLTEEEFKEELEREKIQEKTELEEAERRRLRFEFTTNIIAARMYSLRNLIVEVGFDCEIRYLPFHKEERLMADHAQFTRRFEVLMTSANAILRCNEIREHWGGTGELQYEQDIDGDMANMWIRRAMEIFFSLLNVGENREDTKRILRDHAAVRAEGDKKEVVKQEHDHTLDLAMADLCTDVEVEFLKPKMWG
jgi:hypothetical protein